MKNLFLVPLFATLFSLQACENKAPTGNAQATPKIDPISQATTIYRNAEIVTVDASKPTAEAVAVKDGKILAVGSTAEVVAAAGPDAQIIDLQGNTLLPGLIDAHGHISYTSLNLTAANVSSPPVGPANSIEDVLSELIKQRDATPDALWIIGWGYDDSLLAEKRHATRADLDKVSTERPVAVRHVSGHFISCNSVCLKLAGVTAETEDPAGGIIRRVAESGGSFGEPDGVLEESAMAALYKIFPSPSDAMRLKLLGKAQDYYASYGITTVQDGAASLQEVDLLRQAAAQNLLYLDVISFPYAAYAGDRLQEYKPNQQYSNGFRVGGFKLVLDGSPQGKTAWLTKAYLHPPHGQEQGYVGYATLKDEQVAHFVDYGFSNNVPFMAHANGDAAADQLIRAVTAANEKHGNADRRTVMIHAQTVREDQIDAMLEQNILPSYFSAHTFYWGDWHRDSVFGVERASRISPLRSSADKGLLYTTHNDTPIVPPDMMRLIWASVNRITRSGEVLGEAQRATVMEAIKSVTINAAYQYFEEANKGSISVGKNADFVLLDSNPLTIEPIAIKDIRVLKTIKDGKVVFSKD